MWKRQWKPVHPNALYASCGSVFDRHHMPHYMPRVHMPVPGLLATHIPTWDEMVRILKMCWFHICTPPMNQYPTRPKHSIRQVRQVPFCRPQKRPGEKVRIPLLLIPTIGPADPAIMSSCGGKDGDPGNSGVGGKVRDLCF